MGVLRRSAHLARCSLLLSIFFGAGHLSLFPVLGLSCLRTALSVCLVLLQLSSVLLGLVICFSGWLDRRLLPKCASSLVPPRRSDMQRWLVSDAGERWLVKLDVRDWGAGGGGGGREGES